MISAPNHLEGYGRGAGAEVEGEAARPSNARRNDARGAAALGADALDAVADRYRVEVPFAKIASALAEFAGGAEFEQRGVIAGLPCGRLGHIHEIAAVLSAARRQAGAHRLAFQPHRYTRTRDLMNEFGAALASADEVVLTAIYAASEEPIPGITTEALAAVVNKGRSTAVHVVPKLEEVAARVADIARDGDLVITLGAGSIGGLAAALVQELERRQERA